MKRKINLLQVVDGFRLGGAETKLLELVLNLDRTKFNVIVCSLLEEGQLTEKFKKAADKLYILNRKHRFDITLIPKFAQLIRKENIDIVQTTLFYADVVTPPVAKAMNVPVVLSWETISHFNDFYNPFHRRSAYRFSMNFVDKIIAVSDDVKSSIVALRKISSQKIVVIPYGVNLAEFNSKKNKKIKSQLDINPEDLVIGVVARLHPVKGHKYLIRALPAIKERFPNIKCLIVGDGDYRSVLEKECLEYKVSDIVKFLGFRDDVSDILNMLDVFVLPSVSEGLPNVILEAMASSVPVVATNVGGIPEVVKHNKTGKLIQSKDPEQLSKAIIEVLEGEKVSTYIQNAHNLIRKKYSLEHQIKQFEKLYTELLLSKGLNVF